MTSPTRTPPTQPEHGTARMAHTDPRLPRPHRLRRPLLAMALLVPLIAGCGAPPVEETRSLDTRLRLAEKLDDPAATQLLREAAARNPRDAALQERLAASAERSGQEAEAASPVSGSTSTNVTEAGRANSSPPSSGLSSTARRTNSVHAGSAASAPVKSNSSPSSKPTHTTQTRPGV